MGKTSVGLRRAIAAGAAVVVVGGFAAFHVPQLIALYNVRKMVRRTPGLTMVPRPISIQDSRPIDGVPLSYFGVEFRAPWNHVEEVKKSSASARIQFKAGQFVMIWDPKRALDRVATLRSGASKGAIEIFGDEATRSNYSLVRTELNLTPGQISLLMPAREAIRDLLLLQLKIIETTNAETGLFSFEVRGLRGFQKGDPARAQFVLINAFNGQDGEYKLLIGAAKGTAGVVTQEDINKILWTIQPVADSRER